MKPIHRILRRLLPALVVLLLAAGVTRGAGTPAPSADEIVAAADRSRNGWDAFAMEVTIANYDGEKLESTDRYEVLVKGSDRSLIRFLEPRDRGKVLLMLKEQMWFYLPTASKPIRVTPLQRLSGNASNGDVAQTGFAANYGATMEGEEVVDGRRTWVLQLTARSKSTSYKQVRYWVEQGTFLPVQAEFRMGSGKVSKRAVYERYEITDGRSLLRRMVIFDALRDGKHSVLEIGAYEPRELPEKMFNRNYLSQL